MPTKKTNLQVHRFLEGIRGGYELNVQRGFLSVIEPEETENLLTNPSFEITYLPWVQSGTGSIALSSTWQSKGARSLRINPTSNTTGVSYYLADTATTSHYTFSLDFFGSSGQKFVLRIRNITDTATLAERKFTATGFSQRLSLGFDTGSNTAVYLYVLKDNDAGRTYFYIDACQCEKKNYATTYCDGEQPGCFWRGGMQASPSIRTANSTYGGRVRRLDELGLHVIAISGLDMPPVSNALTPYSLLSGSQFYGMRYPERSFTIVGAISSVRPDLFQATKKKLIDLLSPNRFVPAQPLTFRYQAYDCKRPIGDELEFRATYAEGLEGSGDSTIQERVALRFVMPDPMLYSVNDIGYALDFQDSVGALVPVYARINGAWDDLGPPDFENDTFAIDVAKIGPDGKLYIGGDFAHCDGVAGRDYIARYNFVTQEWETVGSVGDGTGPVTDIAWDAAGNLIVVGNFTTWDGQAGLDYIVYFDGTNWGTYGAPSVGAGYPYRVAVDFDGRIWVVGSFTNWAGDASADGAAMWDGAAWNDVGVFVTASHQPYTIVVSPTNEVYIGGNFHISEGHSATAFAKYTSGTTWETLGTLDQGDIIYGIAFGKDGTIYVCGIFTGAGGYDDIKHIAAFRGIDFEPVGSLTDLPCDRVDDVGVDSIGNIYCLPNWSAPSNQIWPSSVLYFDGSYWNHLDITTELTGTRVDINWNRLFIDKNNNLYLAADEGAFDVDSVKVAGRTDVENPFEVMNELRLWLRGPGTFYWLGNETTGDRVLGDVKLQSGEHALLRLCNNPSFVSTFFSFTFGPSGPPKESVPIARYISMQPGTLDASLLNKLLPSSSVSTFRLMKGTNRLTCLMGEGVDGNSVALLYYRKVYAGVVQASGPTR